MKFGTKIVSCPSCQQRLRVPIKIGKTLRISCKRCSAKFDIQCKSPLMELFKWHRGFTFSYNIKSFFYRFMELPIIHRLFLLVIVTILLTTVVSKISNDKPDGKKLEKIAPNSEESAISIQI